MTRKVKIRRNFSRSYPHLTHPTRNSTRDIPPIKLPKLYNFYIIKLKSDSDLVNIDLDHLMRV